jgi:hypothetical protein
MNALKLLKGWKKSVVAGGSEFSSTKERNVSVPVRNWIDKRILMQIIWA